MNYEAHYNLTARGLKTIRALTREEKTAFYAWFCGGKRFVTQFGRRDSVFFGKAECEWVDFKESWLGKFQKLGLFQVKVIRVFPALGMVGKPISFDYEIIPSKFAFTLLKALKYSRLFWRQE